MTAKRSRFDRRKKPLTLIMANEPATPAALPPTDEITPHSAPTAPWRLPRPMSPYVLYRLTMARQLSEREEDEEYAYFLARMDELVQQAANDNEPLTNDGL